jgi:hypothetical protein
MKIIRFRQWDCSIEFLSYSNGRMAIQLSDINDESPIATATINVPELHLEDREVVIKDYSENEGLLDCLVENGVVIKTGRQVQLGFVTCDICYVV